MQPVNSRTSRESVSFAVLFVTAVLICGTLLGQAVSQISGTVTDQSGAVVPGVEVTAVQTDTGITRTAATNESGEFVLTNLQTGPYRLEASKRGFRTSVQTGIQLQVNSNPVIPIQLGVGEVSQSVAVEANATLVETQKTGVGSVIENQRILDLPLNGRSPTDLITLAGAAVQTDKSPVYSMNTGVKISVAGGQDFGVYYGLDGAPHLNLYDATNMPLPFPDALQEFKVDTSSQDAQTGTHSGAQVNSVTASGTNSFHGDAFEFLRNGAVNARNFFSPIPDNLKRNQFGGVIGGPIIRNKLFFFGGYQGTTLRQTPSPLTTFVPTPAMLQGDFSVYASAACQGRSITLGAPFTTINGKANQLPSVSPVAVKLASYLPPAQDSCGTYRSFSPISQYYWQIPVRIDYQMTARQSLFFRYLGTKQNQKIAHELVPDNVINVGNNGTEDLATSATLGHTWLLSNAMVNSFRLALNRIGLDHDESRYFDAHDLGVNAFTYVPGAIVIMITGGPTIGNGTGLSKKAAYTYIGGNDDFNLVRGSHQISVGVSLMHGLVSSLANFGSAGRYTLNGQNTGGGLGLADLFAGYISQIQQQIPNDLRMYHWFFGSYVQDTWKVSRRFTANFGVRWEPFFPMQVKNNEIYTFDLGRFNAGTVSKIWTNAPPGFYYSGDPGFAGQSGIEGSWTNFQPRVGFAYDPFGDGKTAIRAGASIAYDFMNDSSYQNAVSVAPFGGSTTVNGKIPIADPWSTTPGGNPFPYLSVPPIGKFPAGSTFIPVPANFKTTTVYSWNLGLQRQFTSRFFASASYLGNHAIHLPTQVELNPGVLINGPIVAATDPSCTATTLAVNCTSNLARRRALNLSNPAAAASIGNLSQYDDGATSHYHGLLLNSVWRVHSNVDVNVNYTWSHCIGEATNGALVPGAGQNYIHQDNRELDSGACASDRRQLFNLTVLARTPKFSNAALNRIGSGWALSTIYRYQSGGPVTILSGLDQALNGFTTNERPDQVLADVYDPNKGKACANRAPCVSWLNPAAYAQPALGKLGNAGAANVTGPTFFQFDISLQRLFRITESQSVQVRAEAFNILNATRLSNLNVVNGAVNNASGSVTKSNALFGQITNAEDPRILQIALKYVF